MKKILLLVLCIVFMSSMLFMGVGCKEPEVIVETVTETVTETVEVAAEGKEPVTIMHWTSENDPATVAIFKELIAEFETEYPWITVELQVMTDSETKITTSIAAGVSIDVTNASKGIILTMLEQDQLLPLNEVVDELGGIEIYKDRGVITYPNGDIGAIPFTSGGFVWYMRQDLMEKNDIAIPDPEELTFPVLLDLAEKLNEEEGIYGVGLPVGNNTCTDSMLGMFYYGTGGEFFDKDFNVTVDNPKFIEALTVYTDLLEFAPPDVAEWSWYQVINSFTSETAAMAPYVGRLLNNLYRDAPQLIGKVAAAGMPHAEDFIAVSRGDNDQRIVYAGTEHPEECILYMKWMHKPENIVKFLLSVPPHLMPSTDAEYEIYNQQDIPIITENPEIIATMKNARDTSYDPAEMVGGLDFENKQIINTGIQNPYYSVVHSGVLLPEAVQRVWLNGEDPADVAEWLQGAMEAKVAELKELAGN